MLKRFFTLVIAVITFVFIQSPVWAAVQDAGNKSGIHSEQVNNSKIYTLDYNVQAFLSQDNTFQSVRRERSRDEGTGQVSGLWIVSIFIQGLGQILLGDILRGLSFYLWDLALLLIGGVIVAATGATSNSPVVSTTGAVVGIGWLIIYIWNIVDAYNLAVEKANTESMNINERMALIEKIENFNKKVVLKNDSLTYQFNF